MQDLLEAPEENLGAVPISNPKAQAQPQAQIQPQVQVQPQEAQAQPQGVQVQPEVQIQDEPDQTQMLIELDPNQSGISAANTEAMDVSDISSRRCRPGGKSWARMNRKPKSSQMQMEKE
ncbi:uncharacterized protein DFL_004558 [Arthrobotrys flagrans]|uniref:Uncharacterized protein n=1 Tax=Arthrobotrys flagrans TaxID=97331 RepID=A0A437A599_ARTFL|nr:hypothetical protein DFL_004558 [Arthrobotrys flagrans]